MTTNFHSGGNGDVSGELVQAIITGVDRACGHFEGRTREILADNGIENPEERNWHDVDDAVGAYTDLLDSTGEHTVRRIGKEIPQVVSFPDRPDSVAEALAALDELHDSLHRGDAGGYEFERTGDETGRLVCKTPYPAALERGILRGIAQRFSETGYISTDVVGTRRENGLLVTTVDVEWWESTDISAGTEIDADATTTAAFAASD